MHVTHSLVAPLVHIDDSVEKAVNPFAGAAHCRHHRHPYHAAEFLIVEHCSGRAELVVHIQGYYHGVVHVDKLCGEIEVALEV